MKAELNGRRRERIGNNLLIDEEPIRVPRTLAEDIGLKEAIILSYITENGPMNITRLERELSFMSRVTIQRSIDTLERLGLLKDVSYTDPYEIRDMVLSMKTEDMEICEWCGGRSISLHEHHFPTPRRQGGLKVVRICPNCHYGYHHLESKRVSSKMSAQEVFGSEGKENTRP